MPCRIVRRTEWLTKLLLEYRTWKTAIFVTLTYAPEHLPDAQHYKGGNLVKKDLQDFLKRFRRNYQYKYGERKIRYFAVGEYGDKSRRAHYHAVIYNVDPLSAEAIVKKSWKKGHSMTADINTARMKYTLGYTIKKMTNIKDYPDGELPEFTLMSRHPALGHYALPAFAKALKRRGMYPTSSMTQKEKFYADENHFDKKPFNGWFRHDGKMFKMDRNMMRSLANLVEPGYDYLAESCDNRSLLTPAEFKARLNRLHDESENARIDYLHNGDLDENKKKAQKIARQYNQTRLI